jgi:hypothetical protein
MTATADSQFSIEDTDSYIILRGLLKLKDTTKAAISLSFPTRLRPYHVLE